MTIATDRLKSLDKLQIKNQGMVKIEGTFNPSCKPAFLVDLAITKVNIIQAAMNPEAFPLSLGPHADGNGAIERQTKSSLAVASW